MLTLTSALARTVRLHAHRTAIIDAEGCVSWAQFGDRIARAADVLRRQGVEPGDRYGLLAHNGFRLAELMHAGYWLGAVPVPINYRLAPPEIAGILNNAECRLLVIEDAFAELLQNGALSHWSDRTLYLAPEPADVAWPQYEPLMADSERAPPHDATEDEDALLIYTGGTTGRGKGVRLSHRNIAINALQIGFEFSARPEDVYLHVAPMFHSADLIGSAYTLAGAAHVFLPRFSGTAVLEAIHSFGVTSTMLTPTMVYLILNEPALERYKLSSFRQFIYGSSPMAVPWIEKALARLEGVEMVQGYGLTETSPILTLLTMADHRGAIDSGDHEVLGSAGRAVAAVEMKIVGEDGAEVSVGEPGEVVVRGPNVSEGYLNRPDAMAEAFRGGWFYTGDIGRMDTRGYLYLLDRKKDMIITGSEIVFSLEVEAILITHPDVQECAVVGVPDEKYGEALLAAVVPVPGKALSDDELIAHCRGKIGGYKIPRHYVFLDALPKSTMNKVLKGELRQVYGEETSS